jgi:capsular exopolysaccharide synthesis family protein
VLLKIAEEKDVAGAKMLKVRIKQYENVIENYSRNPRPPEPPVVVTARDMLVKLGRQLEERREELRAEVAAQIKAGDVPGTMNQLKLQKLLANTLAEHLTTLDEDIQTQEKVIEPLSKTHAEMDTVTAEIKSDELFAASLNEKIQRLQVEVRGANRIQLYQEAELQKKDTKKQLLGAIAAPVLVFFLTCMLLAMGEHRKRRIHHAGEVSRGLGIRVVGAVPDLPNLEHRLVGPTGEPELEGHPALESIDALRTLLLHDTGKGPVRVVMVTSAVAGEGKTTLASHLASSLARAGRKTLLVDGDLRAPALHQLFEVPLQPGFSEVLLGEVEIADAVQPTTLDGLSVLPAGQWDRTVLQALARDGLEGVFDKLRQEFEFIVVDSHPVLAATDSLLLARKADGVLLSVLRQVSQMPQVYAADQKLAGLNVRMLGAVVNAADPNEMFSGAGVPAATAAA